MTKEYIPSPECYEDWVGTANVLRKHGYDPNMKLMRTVSKFDRIRTGLGLVKGLIGPRAIMHKDDVDKLVAWLQARQLDLTSSTPPPMTTPKKRKYTKHSNDSISIAQELQRAYKTIEHLLAELDDLREQNRQFRELRSPQPNKRVLGALAVYGD